MADPATEPLGFTIRTETPVVFLGVDLDGLMRFDRAHDSAARVGVFDDADNLLGTVPCALPKPQGTITIRALEAGQ